MLFDIMTGAIVGMDSFTWYMLAPDSALVSMYFIVELGGVLILLIKLILGVLLLILLIIASSHH